jgi:hypothetical protein
MESCRRCRRADRGGGKQCESKNAVCPAAEGCAMFGKAPTTLAAWSSDPGAPALFESAGPGAPRLPCATRRIHMRARRSLRLTRKTMRIDSDFPAAPRKTMRIDSLLADPDASWVGPAGQCTTALRGITESGAEFESRSNAPAGQTVDARYRRRGASVWEMRAGSPLSHNKRGTNAV